MLHEIVDVKPLDDYQIRLRFEDDLEGVVNIACLVRFEGVFASLSDKAEFDKVRINPELGAVEWPCGADLDPDVLHEIIRNQGITSTPSAAR